MSVGGYPLGAQPTHGVLVAPQLYAPIHQHYFNFRLDLDIDGINNSVYEVDSVNDPPGVGNPYNSSYGPQYSLIKSEAEARRDANPATGRSWLVVNHSQHNSIGQPTGYKIVPGADVARPFAHKRASLLRRAGFIRHTLWVTTYNPAERYAAGDYMNQNPEPDGLAQWVTRDRPLENTDLIAWYTVGVHHIPRPEDWPVMQVAFARFRLKPAGLFQQNPAMDVPLPKPRQHCCD